MEVQTLKTIDMLTKDSVSIITQRYYGDDKLGEPMRGAYSNSNVDRIRLQTDHGDSIYSSVVVIWGDTPSVSDIIDI